MHSHSYTRSSARSNEAVKTKTVTRNIVQGRKTWKRTTDGERVWPPEAEAALLEGESVCICCLLLQHTYFVSGLEMYQPEQSRETLILGRFRMRNRFIAQHIESKTGISRTPKQVGSRLQQLRESCEDPHREFIKLIRPRCC
jgi:transcriptional enhancer factor